MSNFNYVLMNDNSPKISQPDAIKIDLMNHQKTMIYRMLEVEKTGLIKVPKFTPPPNTLIPFTNSDCEIKTNISILGDKVGAGKTLDVITLITIKPILEEKPLELNCGSPLYSVKVALSTRLLNTNLIVVPHKIVTQWKEAFERFSPKLRVAVVNANKEIDKLVQLKSAKIKNWLDQELIQEGEEVVPEKIENYDVILIGETMFKRFYKASENYRYSRMFIDEADTIKLPRDMDINFNFLWLITGTPSGIFNNTRNFMSKIFAGNNLGLNDKFVIKNADSYIEQSIVLPHPKRFKIKCITPRELEIIKDLIPPTILQMINAGNTDQAIRALNCNVDTNENILQVVSKNIFESISNKKIELEAEKKKYYHPSMIGEKERKIKTMEAYIEKYKEKYENLKRKIYRLNDVNCPVCLGEFIRPTLVTCCNNTFCFDCLSLSLGGNSGDGKCPYCRQTVTKNDMHVIDNTITVEKPNICKSTKNYDAKDKMDVLIDLVHGKPNGSFMIFAGFSETFEKIENKLKELNITYHILKGQSGVVKRHIDDFREKRVQILMLNAQFFGAGMNLQMATDIVIYHRFSVEMEEQIVGRAQRLGRDVNQPLNVYYLLHDNESEDINDNFHFENCDNIHYLDWLEKEKELEEKKAFFKNALIPEQKIFKIGGEEELFDYSVNAITNRNRNSNNIVILDESNDQEIINSSSSTNVIQATTEPEPIVKIIRKKSKRVEPNIDEFEII